MADIYEGRPRADSSDVASRKIFIGGLSYSTDEEKLKRYFRDYGIVQDAVVMKDPVTKRSRGFGFITFFDPLSVDAVLAAEPHVIDGRKVEAKRAVPRSEMNALGIPTMSNTPTMNGKVGTPMSSGPSEQSKSMHGSTPQQNAVDENAYNKIFVGGLHYDTRDQEFREYFSRFGKVVYGEVMFNRETHKSRGFGFIVFENAESALRACDVREHVLDGKVVEVKLAIPRSKIGSSTPGTPSNTGNGMMNMGMMTPSSSTPGSVRGRTLSMGSGLSPSVPLSGNSSTLAAAHGSHKIGPGILSGNTPTGMPLRKPASISGLAQLVGSSNSRNMTPSGMNYPTTLRIGPNGPGGMDELLEDDPLAGAYIEDLVFENARPSRALSEPIVRYEGGTPTSNSFLNNDMLNFSTFLHPPSNTPQQYSSQAASRSSSIALPQGRSSFTMGSMSARSPEPMFGVAEATNRGVGSMSLAEKLFNNGSGSGNSLSGLLFPSAHDGGSESTVSPNPTGDMLFSSPTRDVYGNVEQVSGGGGASRRTSLTGANGGGGDIWGNNNLSAQTTSESLWSTGFGDSAVNNGGSNGSSNNGLLATINAYSRSVSKDENPTLTSLLQQTGGWPSNEGMDMSGLPPPQRRHSSSGMGGDGIAASHSLIAELRMNSHEYDMSSNPKNHPVNSLGATWGNSGLGY